MSNENLVHPIEAPTPKRGGVSQGVSISLIVVLMGLVGWLLYDVYQLKENVYQLKENVEAIEAELTVVGALARNADSYAHSHYSDVRLKQNIASLEDALTKVLLLQAVTFNWKFDEFPEMGFGTQTQIGLIAQEVERVYPELVTVDADGYRSIDYASLTPILLEAIKEQQVSITALQEQNSELMERIKALESATDISK